MKHLKNSAFTALLFCLSYNSHIQAQETTAPVAPTVGTTTAKVEDGSGLKQFGFGPALFVISYDEEVLLDSKDVRLRGDGTIDASGTKVSTAIGLEVHYDFSLTPYLCCLNSNGSRPESWSSSSGHTISPYLGVYDIENGLNGIAAGLLYGYWRGDGEQENRKSLNVGLGWTTHKNQLVLGNGVAESMPPPAGLTVDDYTQRKDVSGTVLMISASLGF